MNYDVDYFIRKFEAIPEDKWCDDGSFRKDGKACAYGHCKGDGAASPEGSALGNIWDAFSPHYDYDGGIAYINDGKNDKYQQPTPKQRVLAALYDVKGSLLEM